MDISYTNYSGYKISENISIQGTCEGCMDCNLNIEKMIRALKMFPDSQVVLSYTNPESNSPICMIQENIIFHISICIIFATKTYKLWKKRKKQSKFLLIQLTD